MNTNRIYCCPVCQRGWYRAGDSWEYLVGSGHHAKSSGQAECPKCAEESAARREDRQDVRASVPEGAAEINLTMRATLVVPDGWFKGKRAELETTAGGDRVRIGKEVEFHVKDDQIIFPIGYDERDLRHVYDLLRKAK